jgi:type VI secretion system protein ImpH
LRTTADGLEVLLAGLASEPELFSYFQAVRLLYLRHHQRFPSLTDLVRRGLLVRASVELSFPAADLAKAEPLAAALSPGCPAAGWPAEEGAQGLEASASLSPPAGQEDSKGFDGRLSDFLWRLTVTFMGLYGSASPLPPFYAQEILDDALNDEDDCRRLLDLIALPSYRNHVEAFFHNHLPFRLMEENDPACLALLYSLLGWGHGSLLSRISDPKGELAYLGLFATQSRHAPGLLAYLAGRLGLVGVELEQCVLRWVRIPERQRCRPGSSALDGRRLGSGAVLGRRARDRTGQFRLRLAVADEAAFVELMPGGAVRARLEQAVDRYLTAPLVYDLRLELAASAARGVRLGAGRRLGLDAFLAPSAERPHVVFSPAGGTRSPGGRLD